MAKLPVLYGVETVGEADIERERLYTSLRVHIPARQGLWCAWAVGERGEVRVGVLEPAGGEDVISRRFSRNALAQAGTPVRVELRPVDAQRKPEEARQILTETSKEARHPAAGSEVPESWSRAGQGQRLFHTARFQRQLRNIRDALTRTERGKRRVALVRDENAPFPLPELFCLASPARIGMQDYWVFSFDRQEWPVL